MKVTERIFQTPLHVLKIPLVSETVISAWLSPDTRKEELGRVGLRTPSHLLLMIEWPPVTSSNTCLGKRHIVLPHPTMNSAGNGRFILGVTGCVCLSKTPGSVISLAKTLKRSSIL